MWLLLYDVIVKLREREGQGVDPGRSLEGHGLFTYYVIRKDQQRSLKMQKNVYLRH